MLIELHPKPIELAQLKRKSRYAHVGDIITACGEMWLVRDGFRCQDCDIRRCDIPCRARRRATCPWTTTKIFLTITITKKYRIDQ